MLLMRGELNKPPGKVGHRWFAAPGQVERHKWGNSSMYSYTGLHGRITGALVCIGMVACGGGGDSGSGSSAGSGTGPVLSMSVNVLGVGSSKATYQFEATGTTPGYSVSTPPTQGTASITNGGLLTYTLSGFPSSATDTIGVTITADGNTSTTTLTVQLKYDPLLAYQWHVKNTGQSAFTSTSGTSGIDVNVADAWTAGITGSGVLVNVVDTGLEIGHEDLRAQVRAGGSYNFIDGSNNPTATASAAQTGDHGTSVAGIIGATAFNGVGGRGIAYDANLVGFNFLSSAQSLDQASTSFGGDPMQGSAASADVFNASFGISACTWISPTATVDSIFQNTTTLRSGKGALIIKSAGNGYSDCGTGYDANAACGQNGISCDNANSDPENTNYNIVLVGALNASGVKSSYASTGSNIWITGLGGEYGYNASSAPGYPTEAYKPAVVTTDVSGCGAGYDANPVTPFHIPGSNEQSTLNKGCNYTSTFNGTSSAAPIVSGVVALMLQANTNLTYRDVKYLLATTARPVDASKAAVRAPFAGNSAFPLEAAWTTNAAGRNFHNWYGFGLVDANAAVTAAKAHTMLGPVSVSNLDSSTTQTTIPYGTTPAGFTFTQGTDKTVEEVIVNLTVDTDNFRSYCAHIDLVSPRGTKSILMNGYAGAYSQPNGSVIRMLSNAFYGESSSGDWTMNVYNGCNGVSMKLAATVPTLTIRGH